MTRQNLVIRWPENVFQSALNLGQTQRTLNFFFQRVYINNIFNVDFNAFWTKYTRSKTFGTLFSFNTWDIKVL